MKEMVGGCCVCSDERGWPDNPLVYCDGNGCTVAVHQACYGIVTVPTGPWYCRKCESPEAKGKVRCELCPSRSGALKRTDTGGWAHVVCALYIPEVRFGDVTSMEPIVLGLIPAERYHKICYICQEQGKGNRATAGACMQCNKSACKQQFHVTCAQSLGLLCEEAGNYLDNVKYCGYCQHHYSKLKKGGNVKTIPPYKPVPQDSQSSDSSGEKEGGVSPVASGSGTPTQNTKSKGPGRKSSHSSGSGKNTPASSKQQPTVPMDKKKSPNRRGSSAGDGGGSKNSTPAPSPQHSSEPTPPSKGSGTAKSSPPPASPTTKHEAVGVISSVASAAAAAASAMNSLSTGTSITTSVVQTPKSTYQESVITNTDAMDTKQTKKRKAAQAAAAAAAVAAAAAAAATASASNTATDYSTTASSHGNTDVPPLPTTPWDQRDDTLEPADKHIKRAKMDHEPSPAHYSNMSSAPPPPPPAHSPSQLNSRHMSGTMAGPSGMNPPQSAIRSPSQHQGMRHERDGHASLVVSVPLPSTSYGINLSTHPQGLQVSQASDMSTMTPHIFHPPQQKQATLESGHPGHPSHGHPQRSAWGGLNVQYEQQHIQQDPNKPGMSGMSGANKDPNAGPPMQPMAPMPQTTIRNKKRAAMSTVVSMANPPLPPPPAPMPPAPIRTKKRAAMSTIMPMEPPPPPPPLRHNMASTSTQSLASVRRQPQPTPPLYTETVKDSPPTSPGDRVLKKPEPKMSQTAPHMLGNELNPDSGAAARLQEQLTAELAAHAAGSVGPDPLVLPPLINKAAGARGTSSAQSLDQLLERQWEQGSQFLMEQAQHFDIASLLSCLHQLRTENVRLEEHVSNLLQRRDHLLAVNARLAIPLTADPFVFPAPVPPPPPREPCPRENGPPIRAPPPPPSRTETITSGHHSMTAEQRSHQLMMREVQQKPS